MDMVTPFDAERPLTLQDRICHPLTIGYSANSLSGTLSMRLTLSGLGECALFQDSVCSIICTYSASRMSSYIPLITVTHPLCDDM